MILINKNKLIRSIRFEKKWSHLYKGVKIYYGGYLYSETRQIYVHYFLFYPDNGTISKSGSYEYSNKILSKIEKRNMSETLIDVDPSYEY